MQDLFTPEKGAVVRTEHGPAKVYTCLAGRRRFLFLPRHGTDHSIPPHKINFKANLRALQLSGVERVIATSAVGSISRKLRPGGLGLLDQFIDFSKSHATFFDDRPVHVDMTRPYDLGQQKVIIGAARKMGEKLRQGLVYVSVDGPRYETAAEIRAFALLGGDVVGMTGAPEAILANELGLRYSSVVVATNWAAGIQEKISHDQVVTVTAGTLPRMRRLLLTAIEAL